MFTLLSYAGAAVLVPALLTAPRAQDCQLDRLTYVSADDRAVARLTAATHDYIAYGKHGGLFNDEAAAIFRFHLRISRWLHRYDATTTITDTAAHHAATAPGIAEAALPELPEELAYRLTGPHLLLIDRHTHAVIDLLPDAFGARW
jgi:hypothetical protein